MIRTRLIVGTILALAAGGILVGDDHLSIPGLPFPCLFACLMALGILASRELVAIIPEAIQPAMCPVMTGTVLCLAANWVPPLGRAVWPLLAIAFSATLIAAFLLEMYRFTGETGHVVPRLGTTLLAVAYLGVLPCFFAQIRFLPHPHASLLLALVIFVPKGNDIAAFFTGTFLGRHKMTGVLSPKKTWEGFAGGMIGGVLVAVGVSFVSLAQPVFGSVVEAVGFGLAVGLAGVLGDLAESLIKRDCHTKDASKSIPGFGGLLDVVDSVLFAAPVAFLWFSIR